MAGYYPKTIRVLQLHSSPVVEYIGPTARFADDLSGTFLSFLLQYTATTQLAHSNRAIWLLFVFAMAKSGRHTQPGPIMAPRRGLKAALRGHRLVGPLPFETQGLMRY